MLKCDLDKLSRSHFIAQCKQGLTWNWVSSGVDLYKDGLTLQAVLHSINADVVQLPRSEVTQSNRCGRVREGQLRALTFHRWSVDNAVACVGKETTRVGFSRNGRDLGLRLTMLSQRTSDGGQWFFPADHNGSFSHIFHLVLSRRIRC